MTAKEAFEKYKDMPLKEALLTRVNFGKYNGKLVQNLPYHYANWFNDNVKMARGSEETFKVVYAISTVLDNCIIPVDKDSLLMECIIK